MAHRIGAVARRAAAAGGALVVVALLGACSLVAAEYPIGAVTINEVIELEGAVQIVLHVENTGVVPIGATHTVIGLDSSAGERVIAHSLTTPIYPGQTAGSVVDFFFDDPADTYTADSATVRAASFE